MNNAQGVRLSDFHYDLPADRIAQEPVSPRDQSRLMVIESANGKRSHHRFAELDQLLKKGDLLILNTTRVFPARLRGKKSTGGKVEVLLLGRRASRVSTWRALVRGATHEGLLIFPDGVTAHMAERLAEGEWWLDFSINDLRPYLDQHGEMPLPPYIRRGEPRGDDRDRYQTVFAQTEGAVAAPTAGFHFTPELLDRLTRKGVDWREIVLHVGWGTFRPVRSEDVTEHAMLPEWFKLPAETAAAIRQAKEEGRRVIAVGTTVVRTLESSAGVDGRVKENEGETNLFIYPGYPFRVVDALITNFHLPDSTPILLASAFLADRLKTSATFPLREAYEEAIRMGYRFYSYGDAMFIQ